MTHEPRPRPPEAYQPCRHPRVIPDDPETGQILGAQETGRRAWREFGTCTACGARLMRHSALRAPEEWRRAG